MQTLWQSPTDPAFVQDPYPFYERLRAAGPFVHWGDYDLPVTANAAVVGAALRDRRLGREAPAELAPPIPEHLAPFYAVEAHSMLELDPPRHTRLRGLVLRAFTSRRIAGLAPEIATLCHRLIDALPAGGCDLITGFAQPLPVIVIARLLGVPEDRAGDLLTWSNAMVGMYQARRSRATEEAAVAATQDFVAFLTDYIAHKRRHPADDLISHLIAAEDNGTTLSTEELIATCILLLNAGHEATVHTIGNGVKTLLEQRSQAAILTVDQIPGTVEEILRHDPALHLFTRWVHADLDLSGQTFRRGDRIGLLLAAANRDPNLWDAPTRFDPTRPVRTHFSFGAGTHFCIGAPLARLELQTALPILFQRLPGLHLTAPPRYADLYHFHGLERLDIAW
ncbi:cytochrome P450 [Phaeovulum sp. NW3]|uniref:cytochrome P450 n=1 Tax=Phaeovulum sp. NW3 TaxID=2934933 RepID=UPI0020224C2F|nr:cytochrome P450 [Phaeovulum sp. NW3]MCL7466015.1 cytochrome P450 [Phaeovulum sp. NW3]